MTEKHWIELAQMVTFRKRKLFLEHISSCEIKERKVIERNESERARRQERFNPNWNAETKFIEYGLWKNSVFLKKDQSYMNAAKRHKLMNAKLYGQPIVFDYSYNDIMNHHERKDLALQMVWSMKQNLDHEDPFDINICNFNPDDECSKILLKRSPNLSKPDCLIGVHRCGYSEVSSFL